MLNIPQPCSASLLSGSVVEVHSGMLVKPLCAALVGAVVVQDHMELLDSDKLPLSSPTPRPMNARNPPFLVLSVFPSDSCCDATRRAKRFVRPVPAEVLFTPSPRAVVSRTKAVFWGLRLDARLLVTLMTWPFAEGWVQTHDVRSLSENWGSLLWLHSMPSAGLYFPPSVPPHVSGSRHPNFSARALRPSGSYPWGGSSFRSSPTWPSISFSRTPQASPARVS